MKVSHRELAELERDPKGWAQKRRAQESGAFFSIGYDRVLKLGIQAYEKSGSAADAKKHIGRLLSRNELKNAARIDNLIDRFEMYVVWREAAGLIVVETGARLAMRIGGITVSGLVDRVDLVKDGFRGVLLGPSSESWQEELRMPLIQKALALRYDKSASEFAVGVQALDSSGLESRRFEAREMSRAEGRLSRLIGESGLSIEPT